MRTFFASFGLFALAQCAPSSSRPAAESHENLPAGLVRDLATVQAFAKGVSGPSNIVANWTHSGQDLCNWNGFYCATNPDSNQNALASIDFNAFYLTGRLPLTGFLDKLLDLALFHAHGNGFSGPVPDLSALKYLYELDIRDNKFSGPFPASVLSAKGLLYLDIGFNTFTGTLPVGIAAKLPVLEQLYLNNNQFSGSIPDDLCAIKSLQVLDLSGNRFSPALGPKCTALKKAGILKV